MNQNSIFNKITIPLFLLCCLLLSTVNAYANQAINKKLVGKVIFAKGQVKISNSQDKSEIKVSRRQPVFNLDRIQTQQNSKIQIRFSDNSIAELAANSELQIDEFMQSPTDKSVSSSVMTLTKGALRSSSKAGQLLLKTPKATFKRNGKSHFELIHDKGKLYLAVWQGAVEVTVSSGGKQKVETVGPETPNSFAILNKSGELAVVSIPPNVFLE